jgi:hypothetical protein
VSEATILYAVSNRRRAVYNSRDAIDCPEQAREPAPNEKCWIPLASDSVGGERDDNQRSGSNVAAEGPK